MAATRRSRLFHCRSLRWLAALLVGAALLAGAAPPAGVDAAERSLAPRGRLRAQGPGLRYPVASDRFGVGVNTDFGEVDAYDVGQLHAGWYVDWGTSLNPPHPAGLDFMQIVRTYGGTFAPGEQTLKAIAAANPGATWIIGNEPDCIYQGNSTPDQYARIYRHLYTLLKSQDPTCRVTIGGIVQATPLRLQWLDAVLDTYRALYGTSLPADLWNIHAFLLREERYSWGCDIPPGIPAGSGMLWELDDHDNQDLFREQIVRFRQWMKDRGQQDKELIVSEYGILMPDSYGFTPERVSTFMLFTFDYFMNAADPELGCPADGGRLVQRWAWYSLNDERFEGHTSHSHLFDPGSKELTALGAAFSAYVTPHYAPYVDLVPAGLAFAPAAPLALDGAPVTVTITATVRNAGNADATGVPVLLWSGTPGQPLGGEQLIAALPARALATVAFEWTAVPVGAYEVGVTLDAGETIAELDEGNNQASRTLLVGDHGLWMPLVSGDD